MNDTDTTVQRIAKLEARVKQWRSHYQIEANENTAIREALGVDMHEPDETLTAEAVKLVLRAHLARAARLKGDLIAAGEGHPVLVCPNCGEPTVDYDGFGLMACPRDSQCYCKHPAYTDGLCGVCGRSDELG